MAVPEPTIPDLLRTNARFRCLWLAQLVSLVGDFFNMTALQTLVAASAPPGASGRALSALLICYTVPSFVLGPVAGVLVDRMDRRKVMIACDLVRALVALVLVALTDAGSLVALLACVFVLMTFSTFFEPAKSAVMPDLLDKHELAPANALYAATWSIAFALGSGLGGVVTSAFGYGAAFLVNAASFVGSAVLVAMIGPVKAARSASEMSGGWMADFAGGLRYIASEKAVAALLSAKPAWCMAHGLSLLLVIYGSKLFPVGANGAVSIGILSSARGIGTLCGPIASRWLAGGDTGRMWRMFAGAYLLGSLAVFGLAHAGSLLAAGLFLVVVHTGGSTIWMTSAVLLQAKVPSEVRGRVFAAELTFYTLAMGLSYAGTGFALDAAGGRARDVALGLACLLMLPGCVWLVMGPRLASADAAPSAPAAGTP